MKQNFVNILARLEPEIKPEAQFQQLESERSHDSGAGEVSQKERSAGVTMRSPRTGKPVPCDRCGEIQILDDCCTGCGVERVANFQGLERIDSILSRLFEGSES
jgi:hypothetical protein